MSDSKRVFCAPHSTPGKTGGSSGQTASLWEHLPPESMDGFNDEFGVKVVDGYGMTEACGVNTSSLNKPGNRVSIDIILKDGRTMTEDEVKDYLRGHVARYKIPEFVEFMDDSPRNPTGKVVKKKIKKLFA